MISKLTSLYYKSPIKYNQQSTCYTLTSFTDLQRSFFYNEARQRLLLWNTMYFVKIMLHEIDYKNTFSTSTQLFINCLSKQTIWSQHSNNNDTYILPPDIHSLKCWHFGWWYNLYTVKFCDNLRKPSKI